MYLLSADTYNRFVKISDAHVQNLSNSNTNNITYNEVSSTKNLASPDENTRSSGIQNQSLEEYGSLESGNKNVLEGHTPMEVDSHSPHINPPTNIANSPKSEKCLANKSCSINTVASQTRPEFKSTQTETSHQVDVGTSPAVSPMLHSHTQTPVQNVHSRDVQTDRVTTHSTGTDPISLPTPPLDSIPKKTKRKKTKTDITTKIKKQIKKESPNFFTKKPIQKKIPTSSSIHPPQKPLTPTSKEHAGQNSSPTSTTSQTSQKPGDPSTLQTQKPSISSLPNQKKIQGNIKSATDRRRKTDTRRSIVPYKSPKISSSPISVESMPGKEFDVTFGPTSIQNDITIPGPHDITYETPEEKVSSTRKVPPPRYKTTSTSVKPGKRKSDARSSRFPELVSKKVKKPYISRSGIRIKTPEEINREWDTTDDDSE